MKVQNIVAAFVVLLFGCPYITNPQIKELTEARSVSIADPVLLAENLKKLTEGVVRPGMSDGQIKDALKDKAIYGSLTTDGYFAFTPKLSRYISGMDAKHPGVTFRGHAYRIIPEGEFPEPEASGFGSGMGTGLPRVNSREELLDEYSSGALAGVWTGGLIRLMTIAGKPELAMPRPEYVGSPYSADTYRGSVHSPQTHYELAFKNVQPGPLVKVEDTVFSLADYDYTTIAGPGIVAWLPDGKLNETDREVDVVFIVKLVPPYFQSEKISMNDAVTGKPHVAVRNKIYVDIVGVRLYHPDTGNILSKNASDPEPPEKLVASSKAADISLLPRDQELRILVKPRPSSTAEARRDSIEGSVVLRVTFLASGQIGSIVPIRTLPGGLTEQAIAAASKIEFQPARRNGVPVNVVRVVEYSFRHY